MNSYGLTYATYSWTIVAMCLVLIGALGLIIYLIHRINQQNGAIDRLLIKTGKIEKTLNYQTRNIRFIGDTVHNLDSQARGIQSSMVQVNGSRQDSEQPQEAEHGYTGAGFGRESAKGVNPV